MKVVPVYIKKERKFIPFSKMILIFSILAVFLLLCSYIYQASLLVRSSLEIEKYQEKVAQLQESNKNLEITFSKSNSLSAYKDLAEEMKFEKITKVEYIPVIPESVAAR
ncbi:hypothetical protein J7K24_03405 [bacterium]|nr:hypothetical protein [bacterium]